MMSFRTDTFENQRVVRCEQHQYISKERRANKKKRRDHKKKLEYKTRKKSSHHISITKNVFNTANEEHENEKKGGKLVDDTMMSIVMSCVKVKKKTKTGRGMA